MSNFLVHLISTSFTLLVFKQQADDKLWIQGLAEQIWVKSSQAERIQLCSSVRNPTRERGRKDSKVLFGFLAAAVRLQPGTKSPWETAHGEFGGKSATLLLPVLKMATNFL